jgi:lysophospholipase L1-like esterase
VRAELLDLEGVVRYADEDPIHLSPDQHRALAQALEPVVRRLTG